ncbi:MAG: hypothetical protein ACFE95_15055 [Candidatus Hodarchaeota archaeon]
MAFDPFFRELDSIKSTKERQAICKCRPPEKGEVVIEPSGKFIFIEGCSANRACFKIRLDFKKSVTKKVAFVPKQTRKGRKRTDSHPTLDKFLGLSRKYPEDDSEASRSAPFDP